MAKDALIKVRCSSELKRRLELLAKRREMSLSDYVRTRLIEIISGTLAPRGVPDPDFSLSEDAGSYKSDAAPSPRQPRRARPTPVVPDIERPA